MDDNIGATLIVLDPNDVDMDVVADLCEYLNQVFENELEDGVTISELILSVGTVLSHISGQNEEAKH